MVECRARNREVGRLECRCRRVAQDTLINTTHEIARRKCLAEHRFSNLRPLAQSTIGSELFTQFGDLN